MYCNQLQNNCGIFQVTREMVTSKDCTEDEQYIEEKDYDYETPKPVMVKPKRVKHRLPGIRLLRQIHAAQNSIRQSPEEDLSSLENLSI